LDEAEDYNLAFESLFRLQAEGRSFSGHERNCVYLNTGGREFADISGTSGLNYPDDGRGVAIVDWDWDGDQDLWISNRSAPMVRFVRNDAPVDNHFLAIRLEGTQSNRDAIGARVEIEFEGEEAEHMAKTLYAGSGFASQSSKWLHFGLGSRTAIDRLEVHWPGGEKEIFADLKADRRYRIVEGSGRALVARTSPRDLDLTPAQIEPEPSATAGRVYFGRTQDMPEVSYRNWDGDEIHLRDTLDVPVLLNLSKTRTACAKPD